MTETAPPDRRPAPPFWEMTQPQQAADRLAGWVEALLAGMAADPGLVPLLVAYETPGLPRILRPEGRIAGDATHRAEAEARRQNRLALAGHLPGQPGATGAASSLALPVEGYDGAAGLLTIEVEIADRAALLRLLSLLALATGWTHVARLDAHRHRGAADEASAVSALEAIVAFIAHRRFSEAARALMTDLAARFGCDRVALGLARGATVRVAAISNTGSFSRSLGLVRRLRAAMEEAFDQERVLLWPAPPGDDADMILQRQAELAGGATDRAVVSVPLFDGRRYRGVILFERAEARGFDSAELARIEALCSLLTPILIEKRDNDRWLPVRVAMALRSVLENLLGRSHLLAKASVLAGVMALGALFVLDGTRTVVAEAVVQGTETRTLAAPFAGFIAEATRREGDRIAKGDLLVRLDDREFTLELTRLTALRAQADLELDKAISDKNRAEAGLLESRIRQIDAQIALTGQQIARSRIEAPFDGLVTAGDLSRAIGRSVEQGEALLVIAPLAEYRADLFVPEDEIDLILPGQNATLKVTPLPERSFGLTLRATMPIARYENGQTRYQVEARFDAPPEVLVPGMTGAARIEIDRVSLARLWLQPIRDRVRLWVWRRLAL